MSGTFQLDGSYFPVTPIKMQWKRTQIGFRGDGVPMYAPYWECEMEWSYMTEGEKGFFHDRWAAGGYHTVVIPRPRDHEFSMFTGVTITKFEADRFDVTGFANSPKMTIERIMITGVA